MRGDQMPFTLPADVRLHSGFDVDDVYSVVCLAKECMRQGWGAFDRSIDSLCWGLR